MGLPNIFVYTHDSVALGEDGPTHQPIEHLVTLRSTPNLVNWRPADLVETAVAWKEAVTSAATPTCLIFSRQGTSAIQRNSNAYQVTGKEDLKKKWFQNIKSVGISAGASTPDYLIHEVTEQIKSFEREFKNE